MERPKPTPEQRNEGRDPYEVALSIARRAVEAYAHGDLSAAQAHSQDLNELLPHADPFKMVANRQPNKGG